MLFLSGESTVDGLEPCCWNGCKMYERSFNGKAHHSTRRSERIVERLVCIHRHVNDSIPSAQSLGLRHVCPKQCNLVGIVWISAEIIAEAIRLDQVLQRVMNLKIAVSCFRERPTTDAENMPRLFLAASDPADSIAEDQTQLFNDKHDHPVSTNEIIAVQTVAALLSGKTKPCKLFQRLRGLHPIGVTSAFFTTPLDVIKTRTQLSISEKGCSFP